MKSRNRLLGDTSKSALGPKNWKSHARVILDRTWRQQSRMYIFITMCLSFLPNSSASMSEQHQVKYACHNFAFFAFQMEWLYFILNCLVTIIKLQARFLCTGNNSSWIPWPQSLVKWRCQSGWRIYVEKQDRLWLPLSVGMINLNILIWRRMLQMSYLMESQST